MLLESPADEPRRRDVEACPRCDALLSSLQAFMTGDPEIPAGERAIADHVLARFIDQELVARSRPTRSVGAPATRPGWMFGSWMPRAAAALASACAVIAIVVLLARDPGQIGERMRGRPEGIVGGQAAGVILEPARLFPGGDLELSWSAVPGADHYFVELFDGDLDTVAVRGPVSAPPLRLAAEIFGGAGKGQEVFVRVQAFAGEKLLARSSLQTLLTR